MKIQNVFRTALIGTLGVGVGILIWNITGSLAEILTYIGAALFIAMGLDPVVKWLTNKGLPRWLAVVLVLIALILLITGLVLIIAPVIVEQLAGLISRTQGYFASGEFTNLIARINELLPWGDLDVNEIQRQLIDFFSKPENISGIGTGILNIGIGVANGLFATFIIIILMIYFTASLPVIKRSFYQLTPASSRERVEELTEKISASVGGYVSGQVTLASISAVMSFIFLSIIGAPFTAVLATVGFIFTLIPLVGTVIGSSIIVLTTFFLGGITPGIIAAIYYYVFYMNIEAYVLSPRIMNRAVAVPGSIVVIAALSGGALMGLLGALIAIPFAASVLIIIREIAIPKQDLK